MTHRNSEIVRETPPPTMPRRVTPRLAWLDDLAFAIAVDAARTYEEMRAGGWPAEEAADRAGKGFLDWIISGWLEPAVAVGLAFARAVDEEAA